MWTIPGLACANRRLMLCAVIRILLANPWIDHAQSTDSDNPRIGLLNPWIVRAQSVYEFGQSTNWPAQSFMADITIIFTMWQFVNPEMQIILKTAIPKIFVLRK